MEPDTDYGAPVELPVALVPSASVPERFSKRGDGVDWPDVPPPPPSFVTPRVPPPSTGGPLAQGLGSAAIREERHDAAIPVACGGTRSNHASLGANVTLHEASSELLAFHPPDVKDPVPARWP